jgi:hypothetical protein
MAPPALFTCKTADGRVVTLSRQRYDTHILLRHPELARDYDDPASQIEHALLNAIRIRPGNGNAWIYVGPPVQANPPAGAQRLYVVVMPENEGKGWWVTTAYAELVLGW